MPGNSLPSTAAGQHDQFPVPITHVADVSSLESSPRRTPAAPRFLLNALLQREGFDSVEHDIQELLSFTYQFPGSLEVVGSHLTESELHTMLELSGNISNNLHQIAVLRQQDVEMAREASAAAHAVQDEADALLQSRKEQKRRTLPSHPCCTNCNAASTPQWRTGPEGPHTLCNVCGLVYAKKQSRGTKKPH